MNGMHQIVYGLLGIRGVGMVQANKILGSMGDVSQQTDLQEILRGINLRLSEPQKVDFREISGSAVDDGRTGNDDTEYIAVYEAAYPNDLKVTLTKSAPTILSYKGNYDLLKFPSVGFCGSRKASAKGLEVAGDCVEQLVKKGVVIVSGYAAGVDLQTHYTALKNGGSTIIVLPEGISGFRIRQELRSVWDWNRVLLMSEFHPNAGWTAGRAMQRNNTIIGLSDVMILIEASENGGSMDAGKKTLALAKPLFTPVYQGMPESALGNQILLTKGAFPLKKSVQTNRANLTQVLDSINGVLS